MTKRYKLLGLIVILVLFASFSFACSSSEPGTVKKSEGEAAVQEEEQQQQNKELAVGDTYEIRDLAVTVTAVGDGGKNYDGKNLLKVSVSYVNNSSESASFNSYDWTMQDEGGARSDTEWTDNEELDSGELAPGGKKSGDLFFLAEGAAKVVYTNNVFDGEDNLAMWNLK